MLLLTKKVTWKSSIVHDKCFHLHVIYAKKTRIITIIAEWAIDGLVFKGTLLLTSKF